MLPAFYLPRYRSLCRPPPDAIPTGTDSPFSSELYILVFDKVTVYWLWSYRRPGRTLGYGSLGAFLPAYRQAACG
jgi:hypothetical protein